MKAYSVIYADPPWNFKTYSEKGTGGGAVAHYRVPSFETLAAMDVGCACPSVCDGRQSRVPSVVAEVVAANDGIRADFALRGLRNLGLDAFFGSAKRGSW
jgi:hypothetical protein